MYRRREEPFIRMISKTVGFIYSNWFHYLQSMSKACPSLPRTDTNWSIMPQGTPAWVCSACWQATALDTLSPSSGEKDIQRRADRSRTVCEHTFSRWLPVYFHCIDVVPLNVQIVEKGWQYWESFAGFLSDCAHLTHSLWSLQRRILPDLSCCRNV